MFDDYLNGLAQAERDALRPIIDLTRSLAPDAAEGRSYGLAAFRYRDKPLLGLAVTAKHLSLHPSSPAVIESVKEELGGFSMSKGTVRFTVDQPIPDAAVAQMVRARMAEIDGA